MILNILNFLKLMGNYLYLNKTEEDSLSIEIILPKSCYYSGEKLSGTIILQAKTNKVPLIFSFHHTIISFIQHQKNLYYQNDISLTKEEEKILFSHRYNFQKYANRSILTPLKIFFSIKIPKNTDPTLFHENSNFIRHYLVVEFPIIKRKKAIGILIQNKQRFLVENKLFKSPVEKFKDCTLNYMFSKTSKIAFLLKTEKNSYQYNEIIPYEIIINYKESNLTIKNLKISLSRNIYINSRDYIDINIIKSKDYKLPESSEEGIFQINDYFKFPEISDCFSVNPLNVYNFYNNKTINDIDKAIEKTFLYPTCFTNFLSCIYCINLEVIFDLMLKKCEYLSIPIELYTPLKIEEDNEEEENEEEEDDEDDIKNNKIDKEKNINQGCDNNTKNNDFEIINKLDFYKVLEEEN